MEWIEILKEGLLFGVPIVILAASIAQAIKTYVWKVEGTKAFLLALGVGTAIDELYLFSQFDPVSIEDGVIMALAGLVFAFITPGFYQLLKATSASGARAVLQRKVK
jgi:hypothetical protein